MNMRQKKEKQFQKGQNLGLYENISNLTKYSRMDQVKFAEGSLQMILS